MGKDELDVLIFALRYAIVRHTYAPQIVCDYIKKQIPRMSEDFRRQIIDELGKMDRYHEWGDEYAKKAGLDLLHALMGAVDDAGQDKTNASTN